MLTAAMTSRSMRRVGSFGLLIPRGSGHPAAPRPRCAIIDRVIPILLIVGGMLAVVVAWGLLRGMGPRARIGRIIAATKVVPVGRAVALAGEATPRYVGVIGRVDADEALEDEDHRPLVLRRRRLELQDGSRWTAFEDIREVVPFAISEGLDRIAVDSEALDDGLVVVTRESVGVADDLGDRVPEGTDPGTPARLRLDLLSSVDHALVLGVPVGRPGARSDPPAGPQPAAHPHEPRAEGGHPPARRWAPGHDPGDQPPPLRRYRGRARRRGLGADRCGGLIRVRAVAIAFGSSFAWLATSVTVLAASPSPTSGPGGDPRSSGQGPGLVGDPLLAILVVAVIGLVALGATLLYVRITERPRPGA